jgi:hypothetical protein
VTLAPPQLEPAITRSGSGLSSQAVLATLTYRIASYWVPLCAGPIAYGLFRFRDRSRRASPQASVAADMTGPP